MLEYATIIRSPYTQVNIRHIEKVQKYFTKRVLRYQALPYDERLKALDLKRLQTRRDQFDLIMVYKILRNEINIDVSEFFTISHSNTRHLNNFNLKNRISRLNVKKYFLII